MSLDYFDPLVAEWFAARFKQPTEPQVAGWKEIAAGRDVLISAPTGSGKTLAAFLISVDRLVRAARTGPLPEQTQVVYVSPLKALSNDVHRNLEAPLAEIAALAVRRGVPLAPIRTAVRTGDTPQWERQRMSKTPPHILVTTPESLFILLTAERPRRMLQCVRTLIVDEIHARNTPGRKRSIFCDPFAAAITGTTRPSRFHRPIRCPWPLCPICLFRPTRMRWEFWSPVHKERQFRIPRGSHQPPESSSAHRFTISVRQRELPKRAGTTSRSSLSC